MIDPQHLGVCDKPRETNGFPKAVGTNTLGPSWSALGAARPSQAFLTVGWEGNRSWCWFLPKGPNLQW